MLIDLLLHSRFGTFTSTVALVLTEALAVLAGEQRSRRDGTTHTQETTGE